MVICEENPPDLSLFLSLVMREYRLESQMRSARKEKKLNRRNKQNPWIESVFCLLQNRAVPRSTLPLDEPVRLQTRQCQVGDPQQREDN